MESVADIDSVGLQIKIGLKGLLTIGKQPHVSILFKPMRISCIVLKAVYRVRGIIKSWYELIMD